MPYKTFPLTIGSVTLNAPFEGPNGDQGGLGDLGSKQKAVVREYPGGIISAQLYGPFPKPIKWSGILFGGDAIARCFELQRLCDDGQQITFSWAQWSYDGFVEDFQVNVHSWNEIHYSIEFRPLDNTGATSAYQLADNDPFSQTVSNAQNTATQQATSPASGYAFDPSVPSSVASINQSVNQALQQSGASVANVTQTAAQTVLNQISQLQQSLQPLITGSDPIAASAASDLSGTLGIIATAFGTNSVSPQIKTITAVNPNVYMLAAIFYGDPSKYQEILDANPILSDDPLAITDGPVILTIPPLPTSTGAPTPTVMTDGLAAA